MKKLYTLSLCFALLVLTACSGDNLFGNPSPDKDDSVKSLRIEAESAFRKGNYQRSYSLCSLIVAKEPSVSFGYFGMAKSSLWLHGVNPLSVFSLIKTEKDECPFMGESSKVQNDYLQAMKMIVPVLTELNRRDSLTALYDLYKSAKGGGLDEKLSNFRDTFCSNQNCRDTADKKEPFPLSDREYKRSYFGNILLLTSFSKSVLSVFEKNGCIARRGKSGVDNPDSTMTDASKWKKWGCEPNYIGQFEYSLSISLKCPVDENGNMTVSIDSKQVLEDLQNQLYDYYDSIKNCTENCNTIPIPGEVKDINNKIDTFGDDFKDLVDMIDDLRPAGSDSLGEIDQGSIKDEIDKYKAYATFYKMGTHIDEDGDGCIDEDLLDGQDNDGDGLPNANSRLASVDPANELLFGYNAINNSMIGDNPYMDAKNWDYNKPVRLPAPAKICNSPDCSSYTQLYGDPETNKATVIAFTQIPTYWTTRDMDLKLAVAQDTACPPKYDLEYRKQKIGGCWPNYDENKFIKYWLKRELAHPLDQATRVHPSCLDISCKGVECLK